MSSKSKGLILRCIAIIIDVASPLASTVVYFPVWVERSAEATVSGMFVFLGLLSAIPLFRVVKERLRSPSAWMIWLLMFIAFAFLETIVEEVKMIAMVGAISNLIGAGVYKLGKRIAEKEDNDG